MFVIIMMTATQVKVGILEVNNFYVEGDETL